MKEANNELRKEFNELKKLVVSLKSKLNQLGSAKRKISQESKDLRNKILSNTGRIKTLKAERDGLTKKVKELKEEREKLNKEVKDKFTVKKDIDIRRRELFQKLNLKQDPEQLREQIAALELKIETEPMPFSKEKQITKTIKDMKKKYWEVEKLGGVWKEISEASQEIGQTKTKAEDTHQDVGQGQNQDRPDKFQGVLPCGCQMFLEVHCVLLDLLKKISTRYVDGAVSGARFLVPCSLFSRSLRLPVFFTRK